MSDYWNMTMRSMRREYEYAEYLIEAAKQIPHKLLDPKSRNANQKGKSIHQNLLNLYVEECGKQPEGKDLIHATNLLQKLVKKDKLHCLVLNLYPGNEGYSLLLRGRNGVETETIKLPYEESELLEYIDASELPPILIDLLEKAQLNVFYSGCVIVEVRDYRRSTTGTYDSVYVLLRPTPQSLLADINAITNDGRKWSQEEQFQLESQLLLETEEPLCLDPSPTVFIIANRLQYERKKFNTPLLTRSVKKYTQAAVNRKRKFAQGPAPKELKLHEFLHKKKDKLRPHPPVNLKVGKASVDMWKQRPVQLSAPDNVEVDKFAKVLENPKPTTDNIPIIAEEYALEREGAQGKSVYTKITVYQRRSDYCYMGELYIDHDYVEGQQRGSVCRFPLGIKANVDKYVQQVKEIFTEGGRLLAKITRTVPGQPPQVSLAQPQVVPTSTPTSQTSAQNLATQAANLHVAAAFASQGDHSSSSGGKKTTPLQLSVSLGASTNLLSPQTTPTMTSPVGVPGPQTASQIAFSIQHQHQQPTGQPQVATIHRHISIPMSSPSAVSTLTSAAAQLPSYTQAIASQPIAQKPPSLTPTPPPLIKTPSSGASRRSSMTDTFSAHIAVTQGTTSVSTVTTSSQPGCDGGITSPGLTPLTQHANVAPNVNITNISGLPANINIQNLANLQGMNIANLQGLQNLQVSLSGVSVPGGGIAVPVPINMINANPSLLQNQGIIVTSLPNQPGLPTTGAGVSTTAGAATSTALSNAPQVTSPTTFVTMVTALPATTSTSTTVTSTSASPNVTSGVMTNPTSVLAAPPNVLQLPIGNLTQFMPHLKTTTGTLRGPTGLPLLQLQGQQPIQLLNLQHQQRIAQLHQSHSAGQVGHQTGIVTTSSPLPVTTAVLSTQSIGGKAGQTNTLTAQQLMQIAAANPQAFQPQQLQQLQQIHRQQQLQFHPMPQLKHTSSSSSKSKSKKRATPTPPKN